jgi:hypothetical protein
VLSAVDRAPACCAGCDLVHWVHSLPGRRSACEGPCSAGRPGLQRLHNSAASELYLQQAGLARGDYAGLFGLLSEASVAGYRASTAAGDRACGQAFLGAPARALTNMLRGMAHTGVTAGALLAAGEQYQLKVFTDLGLDGAAALAKGKSMVSGRGVLGGGCLVWAG